MRFDIVGWQYEVDKKKKTPEERLMIYYVSVSYRLLGKRRKKIPCTMNFSFTSRYQSIFNRTVFSITGAYTRVVCTLFAP